MLILDANEHNYLKKIYISSVAMKHFICIIMIIADRI